MQQNFKTRWQNGLGLRTIVFCAALVGMLEELLLGHVLGVATGAFFRQYALVMGLFTLAMGLGSAWSEGRRNSKRDLLAIQFCVSLLILGVIFWMSSRFSQRLDWVGLSIIIASSLSIGFLSGCELPLLEKLLRMNMPQGQEKLAGLRMNPATLALIWDYRGMALGALLFSILFLRAFGVWGTLGVCLAGHWLAVALILTSLNSKANEP